MNVKQTREAMGLTVAQFAEKLGVVPSTIYRLEDSTIALTRRMEKSISAIVAQQEKAA